MLPPDDLDSFSATAVKTPVIPPLGEVAGLKRIIVERCQEIARL
jgi:hypothetical protein